MLKHRIIPVLQLQNWQIVKSVQFKSYRVVGHPKVTARIFNNRDVDELILLNIDLSLDDTFGAVESFISECFMPITFGGAIKSLADVDRLMKIGVDKVSFNSAVLEDLHLVQSVIDKYGKQACVISIDVINERGVYKVYSHKLKQALDISLSDYMTIVNRINPAEILLTSVDREGTETGYCQEILAFILKHTKLPVILNGGAKSEEDALAAIEQGADALGVSSIFLYSQVTPKTIKKVLNDNGVSVRI